MMEINILAFGIVKDIFGGSVINLDISKTTTVADLNLLLEDLYPKLKQIASYLVAVNNEYASADVIIKEGDEIAIIPPVSGG